MRRGAVSDIHSTSLHACVGECPDDGRDLRRIAVSGNEGGDVQAGSYEVAIRDRGRDVADVTEDDDAACDPAAEVEDVVMVVCTPNSLGRRRAGTRGPSPSNRSVPHTFTATKVSIIPFSGRNGIPSSARDFR